MKTRTPLMILMLVLATMPVAAQQLPSDIRPLTPNQTVERELKGGETHAYSITLRQGQFLRIEVEQLGIDVAATLRSAAGAELVKVNLLYELGPEPISYETAQTGEYRLEVRAVVATATSGRYRVSSTIRPSATAQDRERLAAERGLMEAERLLRAGGVENLRLATTKTEQNATQWRKLDDKYWLAYTLNKIGNIYNALNERQKALEYYKEALSLRRAIGDRNGEAKTLANIGTVYDDLGERQKALEYYNQALPLYRIVGEKNGEAATLSGIGSVYFALGEKQRALEFYNRALSLQRTVSDQLGEVRTLGGIGSVYWKLGEYQKALDYFNLNRPGRIRTP